MKFKIPLALSVLAFFLFFLIKQESTTGSESQSANDVMPEAPAAAQPLEATAMIVADAVPETEVTLQAPAAIKEAAPEAKEKPAEVAVNPEKEEARFMTSIRQLTFDGKRAGEGYFSADGTKMVFQSEREEDNPFYQIYLLDLETGDTEMISPGHGKTTCAWIHPDGTKVLFASTQDDPNAKAEQEEEFRLRETGKERRYSWDYDEYYDLYEYDLKTETYTNLTNTKGYDAEGAWSPDGSQVVFASNRTGFSDALMKMPEEDRSWFKLNPSFLMDLYIMDADGSNVRQLTDSPGYDGGVFFNADGTQVCWRRFNRKGTQAEVYTMNVDGTDERQLTHLGAMSWAPYFHPSGEYLIFATNLQGFANFELYLVDAAGEKEPVCVTWTDGFDGLPVFSPDGNQLSWTSNRTSDEKSQIFLANWDHKAAQKALNTASARGAKPDAPEMTEAPREEKKEAAPSTGAPAIEDMATEITAADLKAHLEYLASDELLGRMTGTEGEKLTIDYMANAFETWGLKPFMPQYGGEEGYFHPFDFTAGVNLGEENSLTLKIGEETMELKVDEDWRPLSFSQMGEIDAKDIVFAGYGMEIPEGQAEADGSTTELYTSYYHTDITDKWVLMLRFVPEDVDGEDRRRFLRFGSLRYKALTARQKGAKGVIFVTGPRSKVQDELVDLTFDASLADSGIAAISLKTEYAEKLLESAGESLEEIQEVLDKGEMTVGLQIPEASLEATIDVAQEKATGRNVIAVLEADDEGAQKRPALIIGAHIDALGNRPSSASLAVGEDRYQIHHGADDNGSGTAALMEIAQYMAHQKAEGKLKLERNVVFAGWSGEELGLLGSSSFVRDMAEEVHDDGDAKLTDVFAANLNMDMIGRLDESLVLQGTGSSTAWPRIIEQRNAPVGLPITTQSDTYLATDATAFYLRGVPILSAFTGAHEDYHRPSDTADKINYPGTQKVTRLMSLIARHIAMAEEGPDYVKAKRPENQGRRANLRAYLGTVPDYAQGDIVGVKISGATEGAPAAEAGIVSGDIIISLAGQEVKNIYDYTYILETLKVGEEVDITVERKGETLKLKITPGSRD